MAMTTASGNASFLPTQVGDLVVRPALEQSVVGRVATVVHTQDSNTFRVPVLSADPTAAWVAEGAEITPSDATLAEVSSPYYKVAGLTIISREMAEDSSPEVAGLIGKRLAADISRKLDAAFVSNTTTNGPSGLASLTTSTSVEAASSFTTLDSFAAAVFTAEGQGANIDNWVTTPAEAQALSTLKEQSGSTKPLLGADVTQPTGRQIYGRPLIATAAGVATKTAWGIPRDRVIVAVRSDATVELDKSVFFTSDRVAVKATMRVAILFPHPLAIVKITHA